MVYMHHNAIDKGAPLSLKMMLSRVPFSAGTNFRTPLLSGESSAFFRHATAKNRRMWKMRYGEKCG